MEEGLRAYLKKRVFRSDSEAVLITKLEDVGIEDVSSLLEYMPIVAAQKILKIGPLMKLQKEVDSLKLVAERQEGGGFSHKLSTLPAIHEYKCFVHPSIRQYVKHIPFSQRKAVLKECWDKAMELEVQEINEANRTELTIFEKMAIGLYTADCAGEQLYKVLNRALRNREAQLIPRFLDYMYLLDSALARLPSYTKLGYRGQTFEAAKDKFIVGKVVSFAGICSASRNLFLAQQFATGKITGIPASHPTIFVLNFKNGKDIEKYSVIRDEFEVVAPFESQWKITKRCSKKDGIEYIYMQEQPSTRLFKEDQRQKFVTNLVHVEELENLVSTKHPGSSARKLDAFLQQLDSEGRSLLITKALAPGVWQDEKGTLQGQIVDRWMYDLNQFLMKLRELNLPFVREEIHDGLIKCVRANIYSHDEWLQATSNVNDVTALAAIGFSRDEIMKLQWEPNDHSLWSDLASAAHGSKSIFLRYFHGRWWAVVRGDLGKAALFEVPHCILTSLSCAGFKLPLSSTLLTLDNIFMGSRAATGIKGLRLCSYDAMVSTAICAVSIGASAVRLYHGDITLKEFGKSCVSHIATAVGTFAGGMVGFLGGAALSTYVAGLLGLTITPGGWVILAAGVFGSFLASMLFGVTLDVLARKVMDYICPDGIEEEENEKRKLFANACKELGCDAATPVAEIRRKYLALCRVHHPDKGGNHEKFVQIGMSWEIVSKFAEGLHHAQEILQFSPSNPPTLAEIERKWKNMTPDVKKDPKFIRAYTQLRLYANPRLNGGNPHWLKDWFDCYFWQDPMAAQEAQQIVAGALE